jgi:hypothetical protein
VIKWISNLRFFTPLSRPFMPVEFSVAAYRIGHSLVRFNYSLNHLSDPPTSFLSSTSTRAMTCGGGKPFKPEHRVSWFRFFHFPEITDPKLRDKLQPGRAINTQLVFGLGGLPPSVGAAPTGPQNLAERNLKRGKALGLLTGQVVAHAMGIPTGQNHRQHQPEVPLFHRHWLPQR